MLSHFDPVILKLAGHAGWEDVSWAPRKSSQTSPAIAPSVRLKLSPDRKHLSFTGFVKGFIVIGDSWLGINTTLSRKLTAPTSASYSLHQILRGIMATDEQFHTPVIAITSESVQQNAKLAWDQISRVADAVSEPTIGRATGFLPSELCYRAMSVAVDEYPDKVRKAPR